jgi:PAP2 superfamily C-terminal
MQIICSLFMDIVYLTTAGYWVLCSHTSRLILTLIVFYGVRMLIQKVWYSPFPAGFWWYDPGFPSLVVPYGRGSDFFFSGHMGFLVICICEWRKNDQYLIAWIYVIGAIYTCFILLAYQVHYSIDIFTGIFFAHYVFIFFDTYKEKIDGFFVWLYLKIFVCFYKDGSHKKMNQVQTGL